MPTVDAFKGNAPITEVRRLTLDGNWSSPLAGTDTLASGHAYLVFYDDQDPNAPDDYTAPLHIMDSVRDGLAFTRGAAGRQQKLRIENLTGIAASVDLSLGEETGAGVALWLTDPVTASLKAGPARITLAPHAAAVLRLTVPAGEQSGDGEALLQISSAELGTRWRLPVRAQPGSLAGLWVGEVTVNDVSEGRLGATNVEGGLLTIAMRPREDSGITGKAGLQEKISGNTSSVGVTLTLALPASEIVTPTLSTGTGRYLRGYVFADTNQNGERDGAEAGLRGADRDAHSVGRRRADDDNRGRWGVPVPEPGRRRLFSEAGPATPDRLHRRLHGHAAASRRPASRAAGAQRLARIGDLGGEWRDAGDLPDGGRSDDQPDRLPAL